MLKATNVNLGGSKDSYKQWIFLVEPDVTEMEKTLYQQHKKRWKQETTGGAIIT